MKLNVLSFSKLSLKIPINVIGLPVSVCHEGFTGELSSVIDDCMRSKGIFLVLNMEHPCDDLRAGNGETLSTCIFENKYTDFDVYTASLRSPYRRRLKIARKKGECLTWKEIPTKDFTEEMYSQYLQVLSHSDYPLETLEPSFFRMFDAKIFALYAGDKPLAFVQIKQTKDVLNFIFGGMDYEYRDKYDLYYNMLIKILQEGITACVKEIDFGQTAEHAKLRIGCKLFPKYLCVFTRNKALNFILVRISRLLSYKGIEEKYNASL